MMESIGFDAGTSIDASNISSYGGEVPQPIHNLISQFGFVKKEGVDHFIFEPEDVAIKHLILATAGLSPKTEDGIDIVSELIVNHEDREITVNDVADIQSHPYAVEHAFGDLPLTKFKVSIGEAQVEILQRPVYASFHDSGSINGFINDNQQLLRAFGVNTETLTALYGSYKTKFEKRLKASEAIREVFRKIGARGTRLTFDQLYAALKRKRASDTMVLSAIRPKMKMLDIASLNGKGSLAQFITESAENRYWSPYAISSAEAVFGIYGNYAPQVTDDSFEPRFEYNEAQDVFNLRNTWIRSFLTVKH